MLKSCRSKMMWEKEKDREKERDNMTVRQTDRQRSRQTGLFLSFKKKHRKKCEISQDTA